MVNTSYHSIGIYYVLFDDNFQNDVMKKQIKENRKSNILIVSVLGFVVLSMLSLSYASVPLYEIFCRVTGFGGTTQIAEIAPGGTADQKLNIRFESNVSPSLNWSFFPQKKVLSLPVGEETVMMYKTKNLGKKSIVGTATFNVTPAKAGQYFMKIDCFCFNEQLLKSGEEMDMPVTFFIDPDILKDKNTNEINEITLSYTFMESMDQTKVNKINTEG